jgi:transposase-like protein
MDSTTVGMLVGAIGAAAVLLMLAMSRKPVKCPTCGREQGAARVPRTMEQVMWGGFTCHGCGAEMDAKGRLKAKK